MWLVSFSPAPSHLALLLSPPPTLTFYLPPPAYSLSTSFYPYPFYLYPLPSPPSLALHSRTLPILSPPPSTLTLPIYTHSLLPLASLFPPVPCLFPLPSPLRTKGMRGTLSSLWEGGKVQGTLIFHSPPLGGKSEGRDRNKIPEATYPLWGTSPRVDLWGRVRTWGSEGYFFAFFIPSR